MKKIILVFAVYISFEFLGSAVVYEKNIGKSIQVTYRNISIHINGKISGETILPLLKK